MYSNSEVYPEFYKVVDEISKQSPFQKKSISRHLESADERYLNFAEMVTKRMLKAINRGDCHKYIATTYLWYTKTIRKEEMYFAKEGKYRHTSYEEVFNQVYGKNDYMFDYVVGLGMTQLFWPNHWDIIKFFQDRFLPKVRDFHLGAEVGVGHGIFHSELLSSCKKMNSKLLDISPVSLQMTIDMIIATGLSAERAEAIHCDVQKDIPLEDRSVEALLMGELIEHIAEGEKVMHSMTNKMKTNGYCYFSTAANSPAEDHILLFRNVSEIRDFISRTGWAIVDEHLGTLNNLTIEQSEKKGYNINYAAVLKIQ